MQGIAVFASIVNVAGKQACPAENSSEGTLCRECTRNQTDGLGDGR